MLLTSSTNVVETSRAFIGPYCDVRILCHVISTSEWLAM